MPATKLLPLLLLLLFLLPVAVSAARWQARQPPEGWWAADRSSTGLLPPAAAHRPAVVRVLAARTVRWRGIVAVHCWLVLKPEGAARYERYDYTAWGAPIRVNGFAPDGRWFGAAPEVVFAADGAAAARLIPPMLAAIEGYAWRNQGDYRAWPGPNSNTFVAAVLEAVPGLPVALPPTAIGKDYPHDGRWLRRTASGTGLRLTLGGYAGLTLGWVEGVEVNLLGLVAGLDLRRPALKLPGLGRIGLPDRDGSSPLPGMGPEAGRNSGAGTARPAA
ncbi:DUF3750 domain-containing protein [Paracraurococcus ruber]|uniref:DUF3750 domain-containing protein n=1 Tax=Paracraurococcus ruber TaxID=77675 RepID=A0ABS1D450_9PROT|nr:DUF3750 domain-containing protein [Paracraurococcus ruber]MBK1661650.1 hypothetical protein [Paracraurococcus ruber]TDG18150.1 DUF3750 domain-containing protein [Paracraurococcus ruber]